MSDDRDVERFGRLARVMAPGSAWLLADLVATGPVAVVRVVAIRKA